jgi:hypothetical protein
MERNERKGKWADNPAAGLFTVSSGSGVLAAVTTPRIGDLGEEGKQTAMR